MNLVISVFVGVVIEVIMLIHTFTTFLFSIVNDHTLRWLDYTKTTVNKQIRNSDKPRHINLREVV